MQRLVVALCAICAAAVLAAEKTGPASVEWVKQLSEADGSAEVADGVLRIGPYRSGANLLRLETKQSLAITAGRVEGEYRVSQLVPMQAKVEISFYGGEHRLSTAMFQLDAPSDWTKFVVPIRRAPAGTDRVKVGFGLLYPTEGVLEVRDVQISDRSLSPDFPADPGPLTRPAQPGALAPSKLWRVEQSGDGWSLISPEGKPFYSLGTRPPPSEDAATKLLKLGFNTAAGGPPLKWIAFDEELVAQHRPYIPQFVTIFTDGSGKSYDVVQDNAGHHPPADHVFPDVFDPRWEPAMRAGVHAIAAKLAGKPYAIGWFMDNERHHRDMARCVYSPHCAAALRKFLEQKYESIEKLNTAWGSKYASFDELMSRKPDAGPVGTPQYADFHAFSRELVKRYVDATLAAIHAEDPGRLVFSNRFMLGETADLFYYLDLYAGCDGIAINLYPANVQAGLAPEERGVLEEVNRQMHKPIIISEWSVPSLDSGYYSDPKKASNSITAAVDTQTERGHQAAKITVDFYNLPFVVGSHWFTWDEFRDNEGKESNRGLFRPGGQPWQELQDALTAVNHQIAPGH